MCGGPRRANRKKRHLDVMFAPLKLYLPFIPSLPQHDDEWLHSNPGIKISINFSEPSEDSNLF